MEITIRSDVFGLSSAEHLRRNAVVHNSVVVTKLSGVQTPLPITSRQVSKPSRKSRKLHRNSVQNYYLDEACVMVIVNAMPFLAALAILLTYSCSAPIMMPWVQQWRSDAFSPALECQLILQKKSANFTHWVSAQHYTKTSHKNHFRQPPLHQSSEEARPPQTPAHLSPHHAHRANRLCPLPRRQARLHLQRGWYWPHPERQGRSCSCSWPPSCIIFWDHHLRSPTSPR